ncbi:MAG: hypothetical protein KIC77_05530 [Clostridiales bacterium]|nr:hypothetical protein [Clostridiales bacterium]
MRKKLFVFTVVAALLISMLPTNSIFAAEKPAWIWEPAKSEWTPDTLGTGENAEDNSYTTFTTKEGELEGLVYPGSQTGALASSSLGSIDTEAGQVALVKYRTSVEDKVYGEFFWYNGAEHGSKRFEYVHDGNWHFVIVDLAKEASGAEWQSSAEINWFRLDFANNIDTDKTYSVDIAYIAIFADEAEAQAYADADGQGATLAPDDNKDEDNGNKEDPTGGDTQPPKTGDVDMIVAIAAAGLVLSVLLKKKITA